MISIVKALYEFQGVTDDMAFEAAKRLAKRRADGDIHADSSLYDASQAGKKAATKVVDSSALADEDLVNIKTKGEAKTPGGKSAYQLLKKRFKQ
jgi:hypothetical protein